MRYTLAGGGTGGHVYPALSVATALRRLAPDAELLYLGTPSGAERRLVPEAGIPFRAVAAGQVRGKSPLRVAVSGSQLGRGVVEASRALAQFRPAAVFATGGYASVPVVIAARLNRLPLVVFLPDVYPGWA
ncbi:MAG TPA: glycosyltransferase, partial [Steroidobacteraceae bacterium]|nr:glycosyltransferase [Steroidobacteraceae bacterium]